MKKRYTISFIILICALIGLFLWNVGVGTVELSLSDLPEIFGKGSDSTLYQVIWKIRLPRIVAAILLGGALSVSGFLLQSFFQNPIAGPYVLGISSGAKLVVALTMIVCLQRSIMLNSAGMVAAAFVGSLIAMGFVLLISFRVSKMSLLVVCGIMIGYICSAITDFCVTFADDSNIVNLHNWSLGSFSGMTWDDSGDCGSYDGGHFFSGKTDRSVSARRILCSKYGRKYQSVTDRSDLTFQYVICLCNRVCRTDFLCGNRSAASGKTDHENGKTNHYDTGMFPVRRGGDTVL